MGVTLKRDFETMLKSFKTSNTHHGGNGYVYRLVNIEGSEQWQIVIKDSTGLTHDMGTYDDRQTAITEACRLYRKLCRD